MAANGENGAGAHHPQSVAQVLLNKIRNLHDLIGQETCEQLRALDGYRDLSGTQLARIRQDISTSVLIMVSCLEGDHEPTAEDQDFHEGVGASRAWSGITLDQLERGFQTGYERALAHLIHAGHQHGEVGAEAAGFLAAKLTRLHDLTWNSIRRGFQAAQKGGRKPHESERRRLLAGVLAGVLDPVAFLEASGHGQTETWRLGIVVGGGNRSEGPAATPDDLERALPGAMAGAICGKPVEHIPVLVPANSAMPLLDSLQRASRQSTEGLVVSDTGTIGAQVSIYRVVSRHLGLVPLVASRSHHVSPRTLMRHAVLHDPSLPDVRWFVRLVLRPFLGPGPSRWRPIRTLFAVHDADGDLQQAARSIGLRPRTVAGHMTRIRRLFGIDPRQEALASSCDIGIALSLLRLHAERLPAPDDIAWVDDNAW